MSNWPQEWSYWASKKAELERLRLEFEKRYESWEIAGIIQRVSQEYLKTQEKIVFPQELLNFLRKDKKYNNILVVRKVIENPSYVFREPYEYNYFLNILAQVYIDLWKINIYDNKSILSITLIEQFLKENYPKIFNVETQDNKVERPSPIWSLVSKVKSHVAWLF